jgi:hypothetical protein
MDTNDHLAFLASHLKCPDTFCVGCRSPIGFYPDVPPSLKPCLMCGSCKWELNEFRKRYGDIDPEPEAEAAQNPGGTDDENNDVDPNAPPPSASSAGHFGGNPPLASKPYFFQPMGYPSAVPPPYVSSKCSNMEQNGFCFRGAGCHYAESTLDHMACRFKGELGHKSPKCKFCAKDQP